MKSPNRRFIAGAIATAVALSTSAIPHAHAADTISTGVECSITAPFVGTTIQSSTFDARIDVPETVQAGVGFAASVHLNNISVQSEQLSKISGASLKTSTIRIKVGNNVQLDGSQPGVSLSNGVLSIRNKLKAKLNGTSLDITAEPITVRLKATTEGDITFAPDSTVLVTDIDVQTGIIPVTAKASCATTNAKPYATIKATPQEGLKVTAPTATTPQSIIDVTATAPNTTTGKVQFYLNNAPVGHPVAVTATGTAATKITLGAAGSVAITARYIDAEGYNPLPDGTATVAVGTQAPTLKEGDEDTYTGTINGQATSIDEPLKVTPGETVTVTTTMTPSSVSVQVYELGINPPAGVTYVENSGSRNFKSVLTTTGTGFTPPNSTYHNPHWEKEATKPNDQYRGFHTTSTYTVLSYVPQTVTAKYQIPKDLAPGRYMFQMGVYKYSTEFKDLVSIPETSFEIAADLPELPNRKIKPAPQNEEQTTEPEDTPANSGSSFGSLLRSPSFWSTILDVAAGIVTLLLNFLARR
ncbi:membrane protein [Corynebacterium diphtheriae]|nr:membrane protein [Corynebacterium diphtheriae]